MLETIREFARERLRTMGEEAEVRNRHLAFFMALAETAERSLHSPDQAAWADRIEHEHDNSRVALNWSMRNADPVQGLRLATSLHRFWYMLPSRRGRDSARTSVRPATARAAVTRAEGLATSETYGWGLSVLGLVESLLGEYRAASSHLEEALTIGRLQGTPSLVAFALRYLGGIANAQSDHALAQVEFEESLALYGKLGAENDAAILLMYLGDTALYQGEYEHARALLEESRARLLRLQNTNVLTYPLRRLGHVALLQGDREQASHLCLESLEINRRVSVICRGWQPAW
jgi:non-specific serine/threonine protein kinase